MMKRSRENFILVFIIALIVILTHLCGWATDIEVGPTGIIFLEKVSLGMSYSWNSGAGFKFEITNNYTSKVEVEPKIKPGTYVAHYIPSGTTINVWCDPLPDDSWIKSDPESLTISPGQTAYFDLLINVPPEERYLGKGYWFYITPKIISVSGTTGGFGVITTRPISAYFTAVSMGIFEVNLVSPTPTKVGMIGNQIVISRQFVTLGEIIKSVGLFYKKGDETNSLNFTPSLPEGVTSYNGEVVIPAGAAAAVESKGELEYYLNMETTDGQTLKMDYSIELSRVTEGIVSSSRRIIKVEDGNPYDGETSINFPSGALTEDTKVTITQLKTEDEPIVRRSRTILTDKPVAVYNFDPNNIEFKKPVTLTILYIDIDGSGNKGDGKVDDPDNIIDATTLKLFYWDGFDWRYVGGSVNTENHTVTAKISHFSKYALFPAKNYEAKDFRPFERIITPNGDGKNDYADFNGLDGEVKIYDITGRKVKILKGETVFVEPYIETRWDGRDDDGDIVESGVYIYQYKYNGKRISGVIAIAK